MTTQNASSPSPAKNVGLALIVGIPMFVYEQDGIKYVKAQPFIEMSKSDAPWKLQREKLLSDVNVQLYGIKEITDISKDDLLGAFSAGDDLTENLYIRMDRVLFFVSKIDPAHLIEAGYTELGKKLIKTQTNIADKLFSTSNAKFDLHAFAKSQTFDEMLHSILGGVFSSPRRTGRSAFLDISSPDYATRHHAKFSAWPNL